MSGPDPFDGGFVRGQPVESEQGRLTVANWEGFDIEGRLGVGATGTVWLARQHSVGRLVALKDLAPELADNQAVREHLRHEAQVLARLDHPNCVAVYSYLESPSAAAIVMEYVEGVSLRTLMERGPLSVEQALSVLEGALSGLAAAHQQGIVHGDIKPENILLSTSGESKLVDFGLAAAVGTRRAAGTGSPTVLEPRGGRRRATRGDVGPLFGGTRALRAARRRDPCQRGLGVHRRLAPRARRLLGRAAPSTQTLRHARPAPVHSSMNCAPQLRRGAARTGGAVRCSFQSLLPPPPVLSAHSESPRPAPLRPLPRARPQQVQRVQRDVP